MARPIKEGMDYFPHDTDASNDKKIEALRALYGNDGYAFYFIMLEQIYQEPNYELLISAEETREEMLQILASKVAVTTERFTQILKTAIKWNCFDKELYTQEGILTSNGIKRRAGVVQEKRDKMRIRYQENKDIIPAEEIPQETKVETPQRKVKKSKEKQSKTIYAEFVSMTEFEYQKLIDKFGTEDTNDRIESLNLHKGSKGVKYASDYMTILNWARNDKKKQANKPMTRDEKNKAVLDAWLKEQEELEAHELERKTN